MQAWLQRTRDAIGAVSVPSTGAAGLRCVRAACTCQPSNVCSLYVPPQTPRLLKACTCHDRPVRSLTESRLAPEYPLWMRIARAATPLRVTCTRTTLPSRPRQTQAVGLLLVSAMNRRRMKAHQGPRSDVHRDKTACLVPVLHCACDHGCACAVLAALQKEAESCSASQPANIIRR